MGANGATLFKLTDFQNIEQLIREHVGIEDTGGASDSGLVKDFNLDAIRIRPGDASAAELLLQAFGDLVKGNLHADYLWLAEPVNYRGASFSPVSCD